MRNASLKSSSSHPGSPCVPVSSPGPPSTHLGSREPGHCRLSFPPFSGSASLTSDPLLPMGVLLRLGFPAACSQAAGCLRSLALTGCPPAGVWRGGGASRLSWALRPFTLRMCPSLECPFLPSLCLLGELLVMFQDPLSCFPQAH